MCSKLDNRTKPGAFTDDEFVHTKFVNPFQSSVVFRIETSHSICIANRMTFLYEMQHWAEIG